MDSIADTGLLCERWNEQSSAMPIPEPDTLEKPASARELVRVEVEVPEDTVESLLAHAAAMRGEPSPNAKAFKEFLTSGFEWTDKFHRARQF